MGFQKVHDSISPRNREMIMEMKRPARLMKVLSVTMRDTYSQYFTELGFPFSNLVRPYLLSTPEYSDFHASAIVTGTGGAIYSHKITGGTVRPKTAKYLAIPLTSKARKWGSPRENRHNGLELTKRNSTWFLKERDYVKKVGKKWKRIISDLQYVLVKSVTHKPDTRAPMPPSRIYAAVNNTIVSWFRSHKK